MSHACSVCNLIRIREQHAEWHLSTPKRYRHVQAENLARLRFLGRTRDTTTRLTLFGQSDSDCPFPDLHCITFCTPWATDRGSWCVLEKREKGQEFFVHVYKLLILPRSSMVKVQVFWNLSICLDFLGSPSTFFSWHSITHLDWSVRGIRLAATTSSGI